MEEIWVSIPEFEGYQVSDKKRVKRVARKSKNSNKMLPEKILKGSSKHNDQFTLSKDGELKSFSYNTLYSLAFGNPLQAKYKTRQLIW